MLNRGSYRKLISILLVVILIFWGLRYLVKHNVAPQMPISSNKLTDSLGKSLILSDLKGKYVLLSYFQTWCSDCIREIPNMKQLQERVGKDKLTVLIVSDEGWAKISGFKKRYGQGLDFYQTEKSLDDQGIGVFPTTYLLDPQGNVLLAKLEKYDWDNQGVIELIK